MANGVTNPDIVGQFLRGRQANQQNQMFQQQLAQQQADQELLGQERQRKQQTQQLSGQIFSGQEVDANLKKLFQTNPEAAEGVLNSIGLIDQRKREQASNFAFDLINTPPAQRPDKIKARANSLQSQGRSADDTLSLLNITADQQDNALRTIQQAALSTKERADLERKRKGSVSASDRGFENLISGFSPEDQVKARRRKAGLDARAVGSAVQTIAEQGTTPTIASVESALSEAKEVGKSKAQLKFKPRIASAVKVAEKEATERGEALTDLARMEASLPGVQEVVDELLVLSDIATSTLGGRAFDIAAKESGFGSTKGADARAKMIAIVDNQVLPLLKETFGAAFTVQEGENLKASLVDPDASPTQKREQLNAFIAQKERNLRTKQTQLGQQQQQGVEHVDANGNRAIVFADGTFKEL